MDYSYCEEAGTHQLLLPCPVLGRKVQVGLKVLERSKLECKIGLFGACDFKDGTECQHRDRWSPKCIVMLCLAESVAEVIEEAAAEAKSAKKVGKEK